MKSAKKGLHLYWGIMLTVIGAIWLYTAVRTYSIWDLPLPSITTVGFWDILGLITVFVFNAIYSVWGVVLSSVMSAVGLALIIIYFVRKNRAADTGEQKKSCVLSNLCIILGMVLLLLGIVVIIYSVYAFEHGSILMTPVINALENTGFLGLIIFLFAHMFFTVWGIGVGLIVVVFGGVPFLAVGIITKPDKKKDCENITLNEQNQ